MGFASKIQDAKLFFSVALLCLSVFLNLRERFSSVVLNLAHMPSSHVFQLLQHLWPKYLFGEGNSHFFPAKGFL